MRFYAAQQGIPASARDNGLTAKKHHDGKITDHLNVYDAEPLTAHYCAAIAPSSLLPHPPIRRMKFKPFRLLFSLSLLLCAPVWAADSSAFTLAQLVDQLKASNPQLKQNRGLYDAAKEIGAQQAAPDNPIIGLANSPWIKGGGSPANQNYLNNNYYFSLTQNLYFPGKKRLAGEIADANAEATKTRVESTELQLVNQLESTYFQAYAIEQYLQESTHQIARLEQIKLVTQIRYGQNAASFSDYVSAQVNQSAAEKDRLALNRQLQVLKANINGLVGRNPAAPLRLSYAALKPAASEKDIKGLVSRAMELNPDIVGAHHQTTAAEKSVDLAKLAYYPDFQITGYANKNAQLWQPAGIQNYGATLNLVVPWVLFDKERAGVSQAKANLQASRDNEESVKQQTMIRIETAYQMLMQSLDESQFIRSKLLPEAESAYRLAIQNYTRASLPFSDLVNAQNSLKSIEIQLITSDVNSMIARSNLQAVVGAAE